MLETCSLYWALTVMTNLKAVSAHEGRECLYAQPLVTDPLLERLYTIAVFVVGAVFYSVIYGNIGHFVQAFYSSGLRYRQRIDEISEFARFHKLPPSLRLKIRN